jgi:hypothetical protein
MNAGRVARWHIFWNQKSQFGQILEGLAMEDVGVFYGHVVYFMCIWYILVSFGIFMVIWYIFPVLVCLDQEKSGNPGPDPNPKL